MAEFVYRARNPEGKVMRGTVQAADEHRAGVVLQSKGLTPIDLKPAARGSILNTTVFGGGVGKRDLVLFSRQMASMIRAGVPILEAVRTFRKQVSKPGFTSLLDDIAYDIEGGESLSNSLAKYPNTFSLFYLGVVKTGEASGRLSESLETLAVYVERNYLFNRKVRSALTYPIFVLTAVVIVVIIMFSFVVPQLITLFDEAKVALPLPTRILIAVSEFTSSYWYVLILITVSLGVLLRQYLRTPEGQYTASTWALHVPIISSLFKKVYLARLTSILHTLFASNVPVIEALHIARASTVNRVYQRILDETAAAVKNGAAMSTIWEHERYIPPILTTMVGVGERSGEIKEAFREAHGFFQRDVEEMLDTITVFLEPILVIFLAIGVGIISAAVLLPIYNLVLVL